MNQLVMMIVPSAIQRYILTKMKWWSHVQYNVDESNDEQFCWAFYLIFRCFKDYGKKYCKKLQ